MKYLDSEVTYSITLMLIAEYRLEPTEYRRSKVKRWRSITRQNAPVDWIQRRADLKERLDELQQDGMVPVYCWGRDCDQCESDSVTLIPATVMAYNRFEDRQFRYAEGPTQVYPISFEDYADFEPSFRDRRAEQYNY